MIERYSRPEMKRVWSEENKFDQWLRVEVAVCEAWAELGEIPAEALPRIKEASYRLERIAELLRVTWMLAGIEVISSRFARSGGNRSTTPTATVRCCSSSWPCR